MRKIILLVVFLNSLLLANGFEIKGVRAFSGDVEYSFPVIGNAEGLFDHITIEFDVKADFEPDLAIRFEYCDKNWQPMESIFFKNEGKNYENIINYYYAHHANETFDYHYKGKFPNKNISFPFSGKWKFFITDKFDEDEIYAEGRFYVVYPEIDLDISISKDKLDGSYRKTAKLNNSLRVTVSGKYPEGFFPHYLRGAEIIKNHEIDFPYVISVDDYSQMNYFEEDGNTSFSFVTREFTPGNEYRQIDIRDDNKYTYPDVYARYDDIDISRLFKHGYKDLNGGSILVPFKNRYAQYLDVTFRFRPPSIPYGKVGVVGSFSDWQPIEMHEEDEMYLATVNMRRGVYDYQYVLMEDGNVDWLIYEGNDWITKNQICVFVYAFTDELGGYEKIIGFYKN